MALKQDAGSLFRGYYEFMAANGGGKSKLSSKWIFRCYLTVVLVNYEQH